MEEELQGRAFTLDFSAFYHLAMEFNLFKSTLMYQFLPPETEVEELKEWKKRADFFIKLWTQRLEESKKMTEEWGKALEEVR